MALWGLSCTPELPVWLQPCLSFPFDFSSSNQIHCPLQNMYLQILLLQKTLHFLLFLK